MENLPFIVECGDFFIASLLNEFPGSVTSMQFSIKQRPGLNEDLTSPMNEIILRGTWLIGISPTCKNGKEIDKRANEISERIFYTHGVFIQHLIVEDDSDTN